MRRMLPGVLGVAVALGVVEFVAGVLRAVPSPLDAVGQAVIPRVPGPVVTWAIGWFGTANRAVLLLGTLLVALAIGALSTRAGTRAASLAFVVAAGLGAAAMLGQPDARPVAVLLTLGAGVGAGLAVLGWLTRRLAPPATGPSEPGPAPDAPAPDAPAPDTAGPDAEAPDAGGRADPRDPPVGRRAVLRAATGVGGVALGLLIAGRWLTAGRAARGGPAEVALPDAARRRPAVSAANRAPVPGAVPVLTPNEDFFRIDTALRVPRPDPTTWQLRIHGLVERELVIDYDALLSRRLVEADVTLACVSNEVGGDLIGTARWLGVRLDELLAEAGVRPEASQVVGRSVDGFTAGFPTAVLDDGRDALLAVGMNGEPLPARHGFPARLVVPGLFGYVSATKWLAEIELTTWEAYDGYWVPRGWSKEGPIKTASRIDVPRRNEQVPAGEVLVAGVAWAPTRGVAAVELRVDDGDWQPTKLAEPLGDATWVPWWHRVLLPAGPHELTVRAVDGEGVPQPEGPRSPAPDGAEGYHRITLTAG